MALNLLRNTRLFVSTISTGTLTNYNTWELPIQGDFSFSQANETQDITVSEAGATPTRGAARFNIGLNPVDWSFSSYMRPYLTYTLQAGQELRSCIERIMWHGLVSSQTPDFTNGTNNSECTGTTTSFNIDFTKSNVHSFSKLYFYIKADNQWYKISNAQVNQAEVDFSIDTLGTITWSGFGQTMERLAAAPTFSTQGNVTLTNTSVNASGVLTFTAPAGGVVVGQTITIIGTMSSGTINGTASQSATYYVISTNGTTTATLSTTVAGTAVTSTASTGNFTLSGTGAGVTLSGQRVREYSTPTIGGGSVSTTMDLADYIVQKYSTLTITDNATSTAYTIAITGGNITINNNITYLTPESLGIVNTPIGSFSGSRDISGSLTCYLRTGAVGNDDTGALLNNLITNSTLTANSYTIAFNSGGSSVPRVVFNIPHAQLSIPTLDVQDVLSLNIDFKARPYSGATPATRVTDITLVNDMTIKYYAATGTTDSTDLGN